MQLVNIYEAKTHFSKLLQAVAKGEEVIIGKSGKPLAKLVPYKPLHKPRKPGLWQGQIKIADDFDELPPELIDFFTGKAE